MEINVYHLMNLKNYGMIVKIDQIKIRVMVMIILTTNNYIQIVNLKVYLMNLIVTDRVI